MCAGRMQAPALSHEIEVAIWLRGTGWIELKRVPGELDPLVDECVRGGVLEGENTRSNHGISCQK
jgi:hypothetical protein